MSVRSLNPCWKNQDFHARIASLAAVGDGDRVLDLGCGRGNTIPQLLARVGTVGAVAAADRDYQSLVASKRRYSAEVADGRLSFIDLDVSKPLPFASETFDSVVCQDVIECVRDREGLLCEIHRILRSGGSTVIGHHDFDGVLVASDDHELTRRLIHGYADHVQRWQDTAEGQMGRLLPGLFALSPFEDMATETLLFVDLALSDGSYARSHLDEIVSLATEFGVAAEQARLWLRAQEARANAGRFYYAVPWTYVVARRA
jgi:SAM-dependent methyltransferase